MNIASYLSKLHALKHKHVYFKFNIHLLTPFSLTFIIYKPFLKL